MYIRDMDLPVTSFCWNCRLPTLLESVFLAWHHIECDLSKVVRIMYQEDELMKSITDSYWVESAR